MITSVSNSLPLTTTPTFPTLPAPASTDTTQPKETFTGMLKDLLQQTNASQVQADTAVTNLATGKTQDIHQVMLAMEQARLSMQAVVEVRNKLLDAYQEIEKMPV